MRVHLSMQREAAVYGLMGKGGQDTRDTNTGQECVRSCGICVKSRWGHSHAGMHTVPREEDKKLAESG